MIFDETNFPDLPETWTRISFGLGCRNKSIKNKVQAKTYLHAGPLPVVDQGSGLIGGYTEDPSNQVDVELPVIIFGDHTRAIKYIDFPFAAGADGIKILEPEKIYEPRAFFRFIQAIKLPDKGYARHFQHLRSSEIPLPPFNEQRRIAAKLDTTLAAVHACSQRLNGVAAILKRFRQAVLAAATSGELTREWREERGGEESIKPVRLGDVIREMRNGLSPKPSLTPPGVRILRIGAIRPGSIDFEDCRYLELSPKDAEQYALLDGDLIFTRYNGTLEFVGVCALVQNVPGGYVYPDKLIRVRCDKGLALPAFVELAFGSANARAQIELLVKSSAGQKGVSGADLKGIRFGLPSIPEQEEIVRRAQQLFTLAEQLEARLTAVRRIVERLTPALLAKAFRGELVPQDPGDEPASVLLERIRAARQAEAASSGPSRRGRKKAASSPDPVALEAAPVPPDYLAALLRECGALSERALLAASELEPARFRAQLALEQGRGAILETTEDDGQEVLEAAP